MIFKKERFLWKNFNLLGDLDEESGEDSFENIEMDMGPMTPDGFSPSFLQNRLFSENQNVFDFSKSRNFTS